MFIYVYDVHDVYDVYGRQFASDTETKELAWSPWSWAPQLSQSTINIANKIKQNQTKSNKIKQNQTKSNKIKQNQTKQQIAKIIQNNPKYTKYTYTWPTERGTSTLLATTRPQKRQTRAGGKLTERT